MLWRALKDIKDGFYIDVGANDPIVFSVTKWFYEQAWSGINVEPSTEYYNALKADRERDINLCVGAGKEKGTVNFYNFSGTGLPTMDREIAERHIASGFSVEKETVEIRTLTSICDEHVKDKTIHFLKVDVEGSEEDVLMGMDFKKYRPWIVVVEATEPLSEKKNLAWEYLLLENEYRSIYFDGLNKFYIADEKFDDLERYFQSPPNPFDEYVLYEIVRRDANINALNKEIEDKEASLSSMENKLSAMENKLSAMENKLSAMENSLSWRMTSLLRKF